MATDIVKQLAGILKQNLSYNYEAKEKFHRAARAVCARIAQTLGLAKDSYEIRSNKGGIAVSGEVTLHSEEFYIQFSQHCFGKTSIMYRKVNGRKDYTGGNNHFMSCDVLAKDFYKAVALMKDQMVRDTPFCQVTLI